jgi:endonuclease YncB( thermonuclease family)
VDSMQECQFERLLPDGTPVVRMGGEEVVVELRGLEILQPQGSQYREIFEKRLPSTKRPLRCEIASMPQKGRICGRLFYFGWQDKSGDVWKDVAQILLEQGLAKVVTGDFPEREEYLQYERNARSS